MFIKGFSWNFTQLTFILRIKDAISTKQVEGDNENSDDNKVDNKKLKKNQTNSLETKFLIVEAKLAFNEWK